MNGVRLVSSRREQLSLFSSDAELPYVKGDGGGPQPVRVIHYLGSKLRFLPAIRDAVAELVPDGSTVCDLFAGSGAVSLGLASRWRMVSVDIQEYSRVLCAGLLNRSADATVYGQWLAKTAYESSLRNRLRIALGDLIEYERASLAAASAGDPSRLSSILQHGSLLAVAHSEAEHPLLIASLNSARKRLLSDGLTGGTSTVITRHFGGVYFSWEQAVDLDSLLDAAHAATPEHRDFALSAVLAVASAIVNTVGKQFAQPIQPLDRAGQLKHHLIKQTIRDRSMKVFEVFDERVRDLGSLPRTPFAHSSVRGDYRDVLTNPSVHFDAVYADPPYTRDHYSRYYHILETMSLHDDPDISTTSIRSPEAPRLSRGVYRMDRHQSPFCIKSQVQSAFRVLFEEVARRRVPLVLSYSPHTPNGKNRPRLLTVDALIDLARPYFSRIRCWQLDGIAHNKLNVTSRNVRVDHPAEVLLLCSA